MVHAEQEWGERFVRLALAVDEHMPGYVDAYFGPEDWKAQATREGKIPLSELTVRANQLATDISQAEGLTSQRRDYLARHLTAVQMTLRLLSGEKVPLADEVEALYDVRPEWKDGTKFEEAHRVLDEALPSGGSLKERMVTWERSLEIPIEKVKQLLPLVIEKLRRLTNEKFRLPEGESFTVEFVSNQPWSAYNWYLGNFKSRIDWNTDLPTRISILPELMAHEGYPGHHTDLSIKEEKLVRGSKYAEFTVNLINAPSAVMAEGIATSALETILSEDELEQWFREEILPAAGMGHIDARHMLAISQAVRKLNGLKGNTAFMLHDQQKSEAEVSQYAQKYGLITEKQASQGIKFISHPLYRSYVFTYHVGHDLLEELFQHGDRDQYFKRLIEEPVTPGLVRQWIAEVA